MINMLHLMVAMTSIQFAQKTSNVSNYYNGHYQVEFPRDPITNKFSLSQVIETPGITKKQLILAVKSIESKFAYAAWDKKEDGVISKSLYVRTNPNLEIDSSRLFYVVQISQVSKQNLKMSGYKGYMSVIMDMYIYVKEGRYKIELTNFNITGPNLKLSGSADAIEVRYSANKDWLKMKDELLPDITYIKEKVTESIALYFKKTDF